MKTRHFWIEKSDICYAAVMVAIFVVITIAAVSGLIESVAKPVKGDLAREQGMPAKRAAVESRGPLIAHAGETK